MADPYCEVIGIECGGLPWGLWLLIGVLGVSVVGGQLAWCVVRCWVKDKVGGEPPECHGEAFPGWIVGLAERVAFAAGFALWPAGAFPTAAGWVSVKMYANWMDREYDKREHQKWVRGRRMQALVENLASVGMAAVGGLLIRCGLGL